MERSVEQLMNVLQKQALFRVFTRNDLKQIIGLASFKRYPDGATIFQRGDDGACLFVPVKGRVRVSVTEENGKELLLARADAGEIVGDMAVLDGLPRSADAVAEGDCELLVITRQDFLPFLERRPEALMAIISLLSERLRRADDLLTMISLHSLPVRLARYLLELAVTHGSKQKDGLSITSGLSQTDLGRHLAATRESINKQLQIWQKEKVLSLSGNGALVVHDIERLKIAAETES